MSDPADSSKPDDRAEKSGGAFRTISEVSEELGVPQHVLRFWETRFTQIKPLKRGGGRRYYRPDDVALLKRIQSLLYTDGLTIKGVQKLLRDGAGGAVHETEAAPTAAAAEPGIGLDRADLERVLAELTALRDDLRAALAVAK
jgi:DNA-binding transcriptional MerR regulator